MGNDPSSGVGGPAAGGPDETGALLGGRFLLGDLLGVGGSASVYEADDISADSEHLTRVAVKVLHPHLSADAAARDAFLREAGAVASLRHRNIATVLASGTHDAGGVTLAWIALEQVTGGSVAELVARRGPLPPFEAAAILDGVLAALGAAHDAGLVHRDVSPSNVLLVASASSTAVLPSHVRLVDFGLADATGRAAIGTDLLRAARPVGPDGAGGGNSVIGNLHYLSPEHAQGRPVRAAGDLYQAGALLYFLLTGQPPFPRANAEQVLQAHLTAPPPVPSALAPGAQPLDRIVIHALAKTPARRYRDAERFRAALAEAVAPLASRPDDHTVVVDLSQPVPRPAPIDREAATVLVGGDIQSPPLPYLASSDQAAERPGAQRAGAPAVSGAIAATVIAVLLGLAVWIVLGAGASSKGVPRPNAASPMAGPVPTDPGTGDVTDLDPAPAQAQAPPTPVPIASASPATTPPENSTVAVPILHGSLAEAEAALIAAGLRLGNVTRSESPQSIDRVLGQNPVASQEVAPASAVDLTVASGSNLVPQVSGMTVTAATAVLESSGFDVDRGTATAGTAIVTGSLPGAGALLRVGVTVALQIGAPDPDPTPTPTPTVEPTLDPPAGRAR